jgi:hypothetical protein
VKDWAAVTSRLQFPCSIWVRFGSSPFSGVHHPECPERLPAAVRRHITVNRNEQSCTPRTPRFRAS